MRSIQLTCCATMASTALAFATALCEAQPAMTSPNKLISTSTPHSLSVTHVQLDIGIPFGPFTRHFEDLLGRFDPSAAKLVATDPHAADALMAQMEGEQGLMIFMVLNHGALLNLAGTSGHAKRYLVGNPRIALQMTQHDIRAGLYAPLGVLVYETAPGQVRVEYDQPSTLFSQFGNRVVTSVGKTLDGKLSGVIEHAAQLAAQP